MMSNKNPSFEEIILNQPSDRAIEWLNHQISIFTKKIEAAERLEGLMPVLEMSSTIEIYRQLLAYYKDLRQTIQKEEI